MKHKRIWFASIILVIVVGLILWIYPKIIFINAVIKFSKIDSVHIEGTLRLSNEFYDIDLKGMANYSNNNLYSKLSTDYLWNPLSAELYVELNKQNANFYLSTSIHKEWICSSHQQEVSIRNKEISLNDISFKKVNSDRPNEKKYKVTIGKDTFQNLLSSYLKNLDYKKDELNIYLYVREGKISGLQLKDKILLSKEDNLYLSDIDLKFSSWNGVSDIIVSNEIKENSKEVDKNVLETLFSK